MLSLGDEAFEVVTKQIIRRLKIDRNFEIGGGRAWFFSILSAFELPDSLLKSPHSFARADDGGCDRMPLG